MPPPSEILATLRVATENQALATWDNVVISVWRKETTLQGVANAKRVFDAAMDEHPGGVFLVTVVEFEATMPPPESRDALARLLADGSGRTILSAVAYEGTGFRAAAIRSIVSGLALLARLPYPHQIFASVDDACAWFSRTSPHARSWGDRGRALSQAIGEVRYRVEEGARRDLDDDA